MSHEKKPGHTEATVLGLPEVPATLETLPRVIDQTTAPSLAPVRPNPRAPAAVHEAPKFEWTMPRVAGLSAALAFVSVSAWVFWPAPRAARPRVIEVAPEPEPVAVVAPPVAPTPAPKPAAPPGKPTFSLDAKQHVIDPYAAHLADVPLVPTHKYRLRIERDDARLGTVLARLDEKAGWGVMHKMASHAVLQFGGAKALRLHCDPGTHFSEGQRFPLELVDVTTHQKQALPVNPALHCWDFEVARVMTLGEGVKRRIRVPTDSPVKLGEKVPLRVAWVLESLGEPKHWRTGVLDPGEILLVEGRLVRFGLLDPWAGDNEGTLDLEILSGDSEDPVVTK